MKHSYIGRGVVLDEPAAFRRLCVETVIVFGSASETAPAAFRRLCVETDTQITMPAKSSPAAFRRLCVETAKSVTDTSVTVTSRLQAAVC